jgi:hypothetical protein
MEDTTAGVREVAVAGGRTASAFWPTLAGAAGVVRGVGVTLWASWPRPAPAPAPPLQLSAELGADASLVAADQAGPAALRSRSALPCELQDASSWHPSGRFLAFFEGSPRNWDVLIRPVQGNEASGWKPGKPTVFLSTPSQ